MPLLDVAEVKKQFPIFDERGTPERPFVYLDSASSSQKPSVVVDAMSEFTEHSYANVHRGVYELAGEATAAYEGARTAVAEFIGAPSPREVVFTKNVTEAINLVAYTWARANLREGDVILLTEMEHHSNLVPWLILRDERGVELRYLGVTDDGYLDVSDLDRQLEGVKLVSMTAMSNVLGTLPPVREIADRAHAADALVLLDGAQYVPHLPTDVRELGCDFLGFTGHKMLGPTGIGVLWGRRELLEEMPAFLAGGEMISDVRLDGWAPAEVPHKFEAGTPPFVEAVGLGAAIKFLNDLGMDAVREHEEQLTAYALGTLRERFGRDITIFGPDEISDRGGVLSFTFADVHAHDIAHVLDHEAGVCTRASHHCAKPLMRRLGVAATTRASLYVYNDEADVDALADGLAAVARLFG